MTGGTETCLLVQLQLEVQWPHTQCCLDFMQSACCCSALYLTFVVPVWSIRQSCDLGAGRMERLKTRHHCIMLSPWLLTLQAGHSPTSELTFM